jgi:hypothetical protein
MPWRGPNLQDVQPDAFISLALRLAKQEVDISSAADNYLHALIAVLNFP